MQFKTLKFIFRLSTRTKDKLERLSNDWQMSKADVIRKLINDATI